MGVDILKAENPTLPSHPRRARGAGLGETEQQQTQQKNYAVGLSVNGHTYIHVVARIPPADERGAGR